MASGDWAYAALDALIRQWGLACDAESLCQEFACDTACDPRPCAACGAEPQADGCDFAAHGRDLFWSDGGGVPHLLHCDACGEEPDDSTCATSRTWTDALGVAQAVDPSLCGGAADPAACLVTTCLAQARAAHSEYLDCRGTCQDQSCAEGDDACWEAACFDAAQAAAAAHAACLGGCFSDAASVPASAWDECLGACAGDLAREDLHAFLVWAAARLEACGAIADATPSPCFPLPDASDLCATRNAYIDGVHATLAACDAMRRDYDRRLADGEDPAAARAAVNHCGLGDGTPLAVSATVTCESQGGAGRLAVTPTGGTGFYQRSGSPTDVALDDGQAWSVTITDAAGATATTTGVVACPWRCAAADTCDDNLAVAVSVTCNPLSSKHDLAVQVQNGSGDYQLCGDAGGGQLASGERWSVVVTDRQTGACGRATGTVACADVDPACPEVELASAPITGDVCEGTTLEAALRVRPGTGAYTIRWLADGAPIAGQTSAALTWSATTAATCGGAEVALAAEVTCQATGRTVRFPVGRPRVFAAPAAPTSSVSICRTNFAPACAGDTLDLTSVTATLGALPTSRRVSVTGADVCAPASHWVAVGGCTSCDQDPGLLATSGALDFCAGAGPGNLAFTTTSPAPTVQLLLTTSRDQLVLPPIAGLAVPVAALAPGTYRVYAAASLTGVQAATGAALADVIAASGCHSLSLPVTFTVRDCACPAGCDDQNACTLDTCDATTRQCVHKATSCSDGDLCNGVETCHPSLGCQAAPDLACDDQNACNGLESCDPTTGCRAGAPPQCDDGVACNGLETCVPATGCVTTGALSCNDGDPCNGVESCAGASGCLAATPLTCDDGDPCNGAEACQPGVGCVTGAAPDCDDGDPCTVDRCDASGCVHEALACDDGDPCNGAEACDPTLGCVSTAPIVCDDGDPCNGLESCEPTTGACQPADAPFDCDDGDPCNGAETCDPTLGCVSANAPDCDDDDPCTDDACDAATGDCTHTAVVCDDGDACNGDERCDPSLGCVAGTPPSCDDDDDCNGVEICAPALGCLAGTPPTCDDANACTVDACDPATGCQHTPNTDDCPEMRLFELGERLGSAVLNEDLGSGCWRGSAGLTPCYDLPMCAVVATVCYDADDNVVSVDLDAVAELPDFGPVNLSGPWDPAGWCLSPTYPADGVFFGVPYHDVVWQVCVLPDPADSTRWLTTVTADGFVYVVETDAPFSALFRPDLWTFDADIAELPIGPFTVEQATLHIADYGDDGLDDLTLTGEVTFGQGPRAPTFEVAGDYDPTGDFTLDLTLPDATTWEPVPGLALTEVTGTLSWQSDVASATLSLDGGVDLGPLGVVTFEGDIAVSPDGLRLAGCIDASQPLSKILGGLTLTNVRPKLCFDSDALGHTVARVELEGTITLGGTAYAFTAIFIPGDGWRLILTLHDVALGTFTLDLVTLTIARDPATGDVSARLLAEAELAVPQADEPLRLVLEGLWHETGDVDLAVDLPDGDTWIPRTGVVFTQVLGHLERRAGRWELHVDVEADLQIEIVGAVFAEGVLAWTPDDFDFCVRAAVPFDSAWEEFGLRNVNIGVCYDRGALSWPVDGLLELGGEIAEFTGIYLPESDEFDWRLVLDLPELDIGVPLELPQVILTKLPDPLLTEVRIAGQVTFGSGASALRMHMSGLWQLGGTLVFDCHLLPGQVWEPAPGVRIDELDGTATRVDDVWSLTLDVHSFVALGPLGSAQFTGTLHAEDDFTDVTGCLGGALADRTIEGFTLTGVTATLCFDSQTGFTTQLTGHVTVAGQTLPFGGRFDPGTDWTLDITVAGLVLGGFTLDTATFTIAHTAAAGLSAVTLDARLTLGNGGRPLTLALSGAWSHTGALSLAVALPAGTTWSPTSGVTLDTFSGTFARSASGAWTIALTASSAFDLDPFGTQVLTGTFTVVDGFIEGCLGANLSLTHLLGDLPLTGVGLEVCFERDALLGLVLSYHIEGTIDLGEGPPLVFSGLYEPTPPAPCDWKLTLELPAIALGGLPIDTPHVIACKLPDLTRPDVRLEADLVVGEAPSELHLFASGAWLHTGDLALDVTVQPGTTWEPAPGLVFDEIAGTFERAAGLWSFTLGVGADVPLGPFGSVYVSGDLLVEDNGQTIEGCLTATLSDRTVAGFELVDLTAELCLEQTATGRLLVPRFEGWFRVPAFPGLHPLRARFTPGDEWHLQLSSDDLTLGAFTFETIDFGIQRRADPEALELDVHAELAIATGASSLRLDVDGDWSHSGDLDLLVTQPAGEEWQPHPSFTLEELSGVLRRRAAGWSVALGVATEVSLPPVGTVALDGQLDIATDGSVSGCIEGTPTLFTSGTWAGFPVFELTFGACFAKVSGALTVTWTMTAAVVIDGVRYDLTGIYTPGALLTGLDWRIELELDTVTLGELEIHDGHLVFEKVTGGPLQARIDGNILAHPGAAGRPLWLTLSGSFVNGGDVSLALAQPADEIWQPLAPLPGVTFSNVSGTLTRTAGVWSIALTLDSQVSVSPLGTFRAQGELTWDSASRQFLGCVDASLTNYTLMSKPITTPTVGICFDKDAAGQLVPLGRITGTLVFGGQSFPIQATIVLGQDWKVIVEIENLVLGDFTLTEATLTFDHVQARTPQDIITLNGKMRAGPWDVVVSGTWRDTGAMTLQASAVAVASGADVTVGMQASGTFTRDSTGTWTLDLQTTIEVDFGPFGKLQIDGSLAADQGGATGEVCATYQVASSPTVAGIQFTNVRIIACYDHDADAWIYRLEATIAVNGQTRAVTGVFEPGANWRFAVVGTNLALGNGFTLPTFELTWQHTTSTNRDTVTVKSRLVLFAAPGDPKALELDVLGTWNEGGTMGLAVSQPADRTWRPSATLSATAFSGQLVRTPGVGGAAATWKIAANASFLAALGGELGNRGVSGTLEVTSPQVFSACLETTTQNAFALTVGGVSMTNVRLTLCVSRDASGQIAANVSLSGTMGLRGRAFTFTATWQTNGTDGWILTASVADLVLGPFEFTTATLVFTRGARITTITLDADLVLGTLPLHISGLYSTTGNMSLAVAMPAGTTWQVMNGLTLTGASGSLSVTGEIWEIRVQVGTHIALGPFTNLQVDGDLELVKDGGTWKPEGCLTGALDTTQSQTFTRLGMSGVFGAEACFGDEERYGFRIQQWQPLPGLTIPNVFLEYVPLAGDWALEVEVGPMDLDLGPVTLTDGFIRGTFGSDRSWSVGLEGDLTFALRGTTFTLRVEASYDSVTQELELVGTWLGTLRPLSAVGFNQLELVDPEISLAFTFGSNTAEVSLRAPLTLTVRGTPLTGEISGGATLGSTSEWYFSGHLDTPAGGLTLPGFGQPLAGTFCVAIASGDIADVDVCGETIDLTAGVRLMMVADLPVKLQNDQSAVMLSLILDFNGNLTLEARLNIQYFIIRTTSSNPEIEWMMVDSLAFFATISGSSIAFGFDGVVQFKPRGTNAQVLTGIARFSFAPTTSELAIELLLDGRWYSPFGLGPIAIENPGFAIKIALGTSPIPLPTSFGINGNLYWKKSGAWPTYVDTPATCDEFVTCTAGHPCATHLACASNVTTVGGTIFFDTIPTKSGFCFLGKCALTPTYIFRAIVNNLSSADLIQLVTMPYLSIIGRIPAVQNLLPASLTNLQLPTLPDSLSFDLKTLQVRVSTHNKTVFGIPFTAGFRGVLDLDVANKNVDFDGYLGTKGLSLEGRIDPFSVGPISLLADPLARELALNGGFVRVAHEGKLDFFASGGTVEGWLSKSTFAAGQNATFAGKWDAGGGKGWQILVGDPVDVCDAGVCQARGRVTIKVGSSGQVRTLRTIEGVVLPAERTHLAVVHRRAANDAGQMVSDFEVRVGGAMYDLEPIGAALPTMAPASSTAPLDLGAGLDRLDDVRLWKTARTPDDLKGQARILYGTFASDPDLVARYEMDFDASSTRVHNSRYYTGADTSTTVKLHGLRMGALSVVADTSNQRLYAKLSLRVDRLADTGLYLGVGTAVDMPFRDEDLEIRGRLQLGGGAMFGEIYMPDVDMLRLGDLGRLVFGGFGQNGVAGDFDDGLFALVALRPELALELSAKLGWLRNGVTNTIGSAQVSADPDHFYANGQINLVLPVLGGIGVNGSFTFESGEGAVINGNVVIGGRNLVSGTIELDADHLAITVAISLGRIFGVELGSPTIGFSINWTDLEFCGSFGVNRLGVSCTVGVCIGASGVDPIFRCGNVAPCETDGDCPNSKFCLMGEWCAGDLANGFGPCNRDAMCQSGKCGALFGAQCYQPYTKTHNQLCFADDHCVQELACIDIFGVGLCRQRLGYGQGPCDSDNECNAGYQCRTAGLIKRCVQSNRVYGQTCSYDTECTSGRCSGGYCQCTADGHCAQGQYCDSHVCRERGPCTSSGQCASGKSCIQQLSGAWQCSPTYWSPPGGTCFAHSDCAASSPHTAPTCVNASYGIGKCGCITDAQCASTHKCNAYACVARNANGAPCSRDYDCQSGRCSPLTAADLLAHTMFVLSVGQPSSPAVWWPQYARCY